MKETITIRLDKKLLDDIRKDAAKDNRSVNNYIETVLMKMYQDKGKQNDSYLK